MANKIMAVLGVVYGVYLVYLFFATFSINIVAIIPPENCIKLQSLPTMTYSDNKFFAVLKQKNKVRQLGGDTLYLPPSMNMFNMGEGRLSGVALKCEI